MARVGSGHYEIAARVGKARGLEGEVTATAAGDLPFCLYPGLSVWVVPPSLYGPRHVTVASVEEGRNSTFLVTFEEVTTRDDAEDIAGRSLLAAIDDLDLEAIPDSRWVIGLPVEDERYGNLGEVVELIETPANDVLVVEGPYGEVLVPVIDEVVREFPEEEDAPIVTRVMDGIVDAAPDPDHRSDTDSEPGGERS